MDYRIFSLADLGKKGKKILLIVGNLELTVSSKKTKIRPVPSKIKWIQLLIQLGKVAQENITHSQYLRNDHQFTRDEIQHPLNCTGTIVGCLQTKKLSQPSHLNRLQNINLRSNNDSNTFI